MNQTRLNQALYSLDQCDNCMFDSQNKCFDPTRLKETKSRNSLMDYEGNIIPFIEGNTQSQKVELKNALKRLRYPCSYFRESKHNL